jgi:lipopolysaccharide export system permease protein
LQAIILVGKKQWLLKLANDYKAVYQDYKVINKDHLKKLDWYILNKFLKVFFFSIFLFAVIAVVIDGSEKTDDFVRSGFSASEIFTRYYIGFIPHIIALLFPLFVFIAVIFFTSKMAGQTEIIAILASGTSYNRWLRPYLIGGVFLGLFLWISNLYFIPKANIVRGSFEAAYVDSHSSYNALIQGSTDIYFKVDSFTYAGIYGYDTAAKRGNNFFIYKVEGDKVNYNLRAETILWDTAAKQWLLTEVIERKVFNNREKMDYVSTMHTNFGFLPLDLEKDKYTKDKLTTPQLIKQIKLEEIRGSEVLNELRIERYRRDATPITVLLLTLIGAIIAGHKVRGGSGSHLALGFIIAAVFIITDRFSTIFSTKGNLPPLLAAWIPNIIFVWVVYYLYKKAAK